MPTPVKYSSPGLRDAYKALEAESVDSMTRLLPPELAEEVDPFIDRQPADRAEENAAPESR